MQSLTSSYSSLILLLPVDNRRFTNFVCKRTYILIKNTLIVSVSKLLLMYILESNSLLIFQSSRVTLKIKELLEKDKTHNHDVQRH